MTSDGKQTRTRLQPLTIDERILIATTAWDFFSPINHEKMSAALGLPSTTGVTTPFSVLQFLKYLEKKDIFQKPFECLGQIKAVLDAMARAELLIVMGYSDFVLAPQYYYSLKLLTKMEGRSWAWLAQALGPEFVHAYFGPRTVHIIGDTPIREQGGTGWMISDRHILTCAHVLTRMTVRPEQVFGELICTVKSVHSHPTIDVGIIELTEPCLPANQVIGFRDPTVGEPLYVLGYPPVPTTIEAPLILQGGEVVNQRIQGYGGEATFLYSAVARPGNSGGPIIAKSGQILGIVIEDKHDPELPHALFFAGISTSTIAKGVQELNIGVELPIETFA